MCRKTTRKFYLRPPPTGAHVFFPLSTVPAASCWCHKLWCLFPPLLLNDQTGALGNAGKCGKAEEERCGLHTNAALWILVSLLVLSIRVVNFHIQYSNIMMSQRTRGVPFLPYNLAPIWSSRLGLLSPASYLPFVSALCSHLQCTEVTFWTGWIWDDDNEKLIHRRCPLSSIWQVTWSNRKPRKWITVHSTVYVHTSFWFF